MFERNESSMREDQCGVGELGQYFGEYQEENIWCRWSQETETQYMLIPEAVNKICPKSKNRMSLTSFVPTRSYPTPFVI